MATTGPEPIPREQWTTHPRFPDQVLLLGSHANFRHVSERLIAAAEGDGDRMDIAGLYLRWIAAMRSHEAYEERKLYPFLARRFGVDFAAAEAGHERLHRRHAEVVEQLRSDRDAPALAAALTRHHLALDEHLILEEDLVIPCLLSLAPEEFWAYTRAPIRATW